jgi:hypothetical protein
MADKHSCRTLAANGDPGDRSSELAWRAPRTPFSYFWEVVSARDSPPDSGRLFQLDIGRATPRVTRWLSVIPAAPPSGCHAPVGAGMPTRMPDSRNHSADGGSRIRLLDGWDFATVIRSSRPRPLRRQHSGSARFGLNQRFRPRRPYSLAERRREDVPDSVFDDSLRLASIWNQAHRSERRDAI